MGIYYSGVCLLKLPLSLGELISVAQKVVFLETRPHFEIENPTEG